MPKKSKKARQDPLPERSGALRTRDWRWTAAASLARLHLTPSKLLQAAKDPIIRKMTTTILEMARVNPSTFPKFQRVKTDLNEPVDDQKIDYGPMFAKISREYWPYLEAREMNHAAASGGVVAIAEAFILSNEEPQKICEFVGFAPQTLAVYEAVFFDLRNAEARGGLYGKLFAGPIPDGRVFRTFMQYAGFQFKAKVLRALMGYGDADAETLECLRKAGADQAVRAFFDSQFKHEGPITSLHHMQYDTRERQLRAQETKAAQDTPGDQKQLVGTMEGAKIALADTMGGWEDRPGAMGQVPKHEPRMMKITEGAAPMESVELETSVEVPEKEEVPV